MESITDGQYRQYNPTTDDIPTKKESSDDYRQ